MKNYKVLVLIAFAAVICLAGCASQGGTPAAASIDYFQRGVEAMNSENLDQAIEEFGQAARNNQNTVKAFIGIAYANLMKDDFAEAADSVMMAISSLPAFTGAMERREYADFMNDLEQEIAEFDALLNIDVSAIKEEFETATHFAAQDANRAMFANMDDE